MARKTGILDPRRWIPTETVSIAERGNSDRVPNAQNFCGFSILALRLSAYLSVYPKQPLLGS